MALNLLSVENTLRVEVVPPARLASHHDLTVEREVSAARIADHAAYGSADQTTKQAKARGERMRDLHRRDGEGRKMHSPKDEVHRAKGTPTNRGRLQERWDEKPHAVEPPRFPFQAPASREVQL